MALAFLALGGVLVSMYMLLYKLQVLPGIACGTGGCEVVQASRYAMLLGVPVPAWGVLGYGLIMGLALAGVQPRLAASRKVAGGLLVLATGAFLFSLYLTALEMWVIHAWCRWCIGSAVIATLIFLLALPEIPRLRGAR
ncbi:MAG: vitamin K epoxide reductase family protein [Gemmatimonadota bacterium]